MEQKSESENPSEKTEKLILGMTPGQFWLGVIMCGGLALLSVLGYMARGTVPPPMGP